MDHTRNTLQSFQEGIFGRDVFNYHSFEALKVWLDGGAALISSMAEVRRTVVHPVASFEGMDYAGDGEAAGASVTL